MHLRLSDKKRKLLVTVVAGGLGNLLAYLSMTLVSMQPQIAFDLSHLATFAVALSFGPYYGLLTGLLVAIYPYMIFGILGVHGPFLGLALLVGKGMTGYCAGKLAGRMRPYLSIALAYLPESLFTLLFLEAVQTWVASVALSPSIIKDILLKGWVEVIILSFIMDTVSRRKIAEAALLLLEIFIATFLLSKEGTAPMILLLFIVFVVMLIIDLVRPPANQTGSHEE